MRELEIGSPFPATDWGFEMHKVMSQLTAEEQRRPRRTSSSMKRTIPIIAIFIIAISLGTGATQWNQSSPSTSKTPGQSSPPTDTSTALTLVSLADWLTPLSRPASTTTTTALPPVAPTPTTVPTTVPPPSPTAPTTTTPPAAPPTPTNPVSSTTLPPAPSSPVTHSVSSGDYDHRWDAVAKCEEGGWIGYASPEYPDSLGINATNWRANGGGSDLSPAAQVAVAQRIEGTSFVPDQQSCAAW